jgi:hypothetical protein
MPTRFAIPSALFPPELNLELKNSGTDGSFGPAEGGTLICANNLNPSIHRIGKSRHGARLGSAMISEDQRSKPDRVFPFRAGACLVRVWIGIDQSGK